MKHNLLVLIASGMIVSSLSAADVNASKTDVKTGWYMGVGIGAAGYSDGDMGKEFEYFKVEVDNATATGVKLYGGHKFNSIVGVEASYINYGTHSYKQADSYKGTVNTEVSPQSLNVAANLGYDFLDDQLRPFGLAGLGIVNFGQSGSPEVYSKDYGAALVLGAGVEYTPKKFHNVGFRLTLESDIAYVVQSYSSSNKDDKAFAHTLSLMSLGVNYKF